MSSRQKFYVVNISSGIPVYFGAENSIPVEYVDNPNYVFVSSGNVRPNENYIWNGDAWVIDCMCMYMNQKSIVDKQALRLASVSDKDISNYLEEKILLDIGEIPNTTLSTEDANILMKYRYDLRNFTKMKNIDGDWTWNSGSNIVSGGSTLELQIGMYFGLRSNPNRKYKIINIPDDTTIELMGNNETTQVALCDYCIDLDNPVYPV